MDTSKILKCLSILGITEHKQLQNGYLNKFHEKQFTKIIESKVDPQRKNNLLIRLNKAKEILSKYSTQELQIIFLECKQKSSQETKNNKNFNNSIIKNLKGLFTLLLCLMIGLIFTIPPVALVTFVIFCLVILFRYIRGDFD